MKEEMMADFAAFAFTATKNFWSEDTKSQYAKGLSYTARDPKLAKLVQQWVKDGKVMLGVVTSGSIEGKG